MKIVLFVAFATAILAVFLWALLSHPAVGQVMHHAPSEMELHKQFYSRESPDGRGHVCESGMNTFCAVLGAGI